jgi:hypothetical protein
MTNKQIRIGQKVRAIVYAWSQDEQPTAENFYTGKVIEVIERTRHCFYVKLDGLDKLIPIDRATAI